MKHCTNCGLKIAQDVTTCPRCGAFVPYTRTAPLVSDAPINSTPSTSTLHNSQESEGGVLPQEDATPLREDNTPAYPVYQEYVTSDANYSQDGGTAPIIPAVRVEPQIPNYAMQPPPPPIPFSPPYGVQQQPMFFQPPSSQSGAIFPVDQSQQSAYRTPVPPPLMPYVPYTPQPRRKLSRGIIALILVLALLLVSGGFGLIYYTIVARPAQLHAQATATMQTILTHDAQSTAIANTQATGTAVAYTNATVTAQTQATAQAQATVTALQNIYTQATQGTPALSSSLTGQDSYNWDVNDTVDGGGCGFNAGTYHSTLFSKNFYFPCFARTTNFSNFAFQAQLVVNQGDAGGLVFRSNSNSDVAQFYLFSIDQKGSYTLEVSKDQTDSMILAEDISSAIKTGIGQKNTLTVVARGSTLYLYINKQYVGSASDNTYSSGMLGVFASDSTSNTDVSFSNAQVWTL